MNLTTISVTGTKGGVGKTTISANLGALLAGFGFKVLLIDADAQPSLSTYFPVRTRSNLGLHACISRRGVLDQDCISTTTISNLDIVISDEREVCNKGGAPLQMLLAEMGDRLIVLRRAMRSPCARQYDFVIVDTQGAVGDLQRAAAMAADIILSPIKPDVLGAGEFETGTRTMIESLSVMKDFDSAMVPGKVYAFINGADNTSNSKGIADYIREKYRTSSELQMLVTTVPSATVFAQSATRQTPAYLLDPKASEVLHNFVYELLPNLRGQRAETAKRPRRLASPSLPTIAATDGAAEPLPIGEPQ